MFRHLDHTAHATGQYEMIWDGTCGFCKYWILNWKQKTGDKVHYVPYQEAHTSFPDMEVDDFKQAVRLIDPDGRIYSGPHAAFKSLSIGGRYSWLLAWYENTTTFKQLMDVGYQWLASNRAFAMRMTKWMFGKNPVNQRPFWAFYLMIIVALVIALFGFERFM